VVAALAAAGMSTAYVTLHVGVGTFAPIRCENLADHPMHAEWYDCPDATAAAVNAAREQGRNVVAVGTTSVRVLESCADEGGVVRPGSGWTQLFIYPPYRFKAVDAMVTNFHLPGSTLLAMVFAFAGREMILAAYKEAIRQGYRFYSYGDAMVIV
jgi:S-adenosylmethionine:tRNA ribosyltransferase-isomerase